MEELSGSSDFSEFYERLKVIKEHHRKYPHEPVESAESEFIYNQQKKEEEDYEGKLLMVIKVNSIHIITVELEKLFSGEESLGRYLDLNTLHAQYINLKGVKKLDYLQYLSEFDDFQTCYPKSIKSTEEYKTYLQDLYDYLYSFTRRARPLFNVSELEQKTQDEFNKDWEQGQVTGWEDSVNEQQGLYCQACQKAFTKQTVFDAHLTGKKHIKAQKKLEEEGGQSNDTPKESKRKAIAYKERIITKLVEALGEFREETKSNVERKQALTDKERAVSNRY